MTPKIEYIEGHIIYENPRPHVKSRHGYLPGAIQLPNGELLALFVRGEAFESADSTTSVSRSKDLGKTWELQGPLYNKSVDKVPSSDYLKPQVLRDGSLIALGYRFHRLNPEEPIASEKTNGILPGDNIIAFSKDDGHTWTVPQIIPRRTPEVVEIPMRSLQLRSGDIVATGGLFKMPDGSNPSGMFGVLLRSKDNGKTWDDQVRFFDTPARTIAPYESNICEMQDGRLVTIAWAYDIATDSTLPNHVTFSHDNGYTWSKPIDTGIKAQAANVMWLGGERLLSIHCHRGEEIALYVRVIDFAGDRWQVIAEKDIFGPTTGQQNKEGQKFFVLAKALRFGQASLLRLTNGDILATHWCIDPDGQGRIRTHRLRIQD